METITQTNRTILFAEINPERLNLLTLVGDVRGKSSLDDDKIKEINEELLVSSFEEFLEKFTPVVYSWCDAATGTIQYSLTKPENIPQNCITEIPLNESNDLLNMLTTLMSARDAQGVANADFQFSNILEMISPNLLSNGNEFEPIYKTLVVTYIERMLRFYSGDFKQDKILTFFSNNPNSQKSRWDADRQYVNSILQDGDELDFSIDEKNGVCDVLVTFANTTKNLKVQLTRKAGNE